MIFIALGLAAVAGYLLGSLNFAVMLSRRLHGADVRTMGSGNAGMTNMLRNFGKKSAAFTMAGDTAKGACAVLLGRGLVFLMAPGSDVLYGACLAGIATILGHSFPLFFGFKGGKGIATLLGVIAALQPVIAGVLLTVFLVVVAVSKTVSLGSVIGVSFYPPLTLLWGLFISHRAVIFTTVCSFIITALVIWMHRENIKRIMAGAEYKFGQGRPK